MRRKFNGAQDIYRRRGCLAVVRDVVEEHFVRPGTPGHERRRSTVRWAGADESEDGGISNKTQGANPCHRKPKVSWAMSIIPGLAGPKARPRGVVDGQQVDIPAPARESVRQDGRADLARVYDYPLRRTVIGLPR